MFTKPRPVKFIVKPFKYPRTSRPSDPFKTGRVKPESLVESPFVGELQGLKSSDIEERVARALYKRELYFEFRNVYFGERYQSGSVELDFLVFNFGVLYPLQIDGEFAHKSTLQRDEDEQKDGMLNGELIPQGAVKVRRIPGVDLETQYATERLLREIIP